MDIEHLVFEKGPKRVGPFSHAVKAGDFIFITGQMPTLPAVSYTHLTLPTKA